MSHSVSFTLPKDYAFVAAVGLSTSFLAAYHTVLSIRFRIKAKIRHPQFYAELKQTQEDSNALRFNCAQRAHENMLEHLPIFLAGLAWTGIRYPLISSALGLSWIMARFFYTRGYTSENPGNRGRWFTTSVSTLG
ncbi:hypothetical protein FS842_007924, partial [Serendipita sp. 407]